MPLFWRSFGYFVYRYIFRLGFLDGKEGFMWDFLQGWWYRTLVDAKVYEVRKWMIVNNITKNAEGVLPQESKDALKRYINKIWKIDL